jgi:molybdopterin/thiamine biosynthesis adenylyltransferase
MPLTGWEQDRYMRQLMVSDWDQEKLKSARVLIAGVGGLGSAIALYLAAAGVGRILLVDGDRVERSDLNRQVLYAENSLGELKVKAAKRRLMALNSEITIDILAENITVKNIRRLTRECDLLVDGLDNIEARSILNGESVHRQIPYIYGAVRGWGGVVGLFHPPHTACFGCISSERFSPAGVIPVAGVLPGMIGLMEATEALKFLMGIDTGLLGRILVYDSRALTFDIVEVERDPWCAFCKK